MTTTPAMPELLTDTDVARIFRRVYGGAAFDSTQRMFAAEIEAAVRERFATLQAQPAVAPTEHIKEPYTLAELNERIASNDYNAELLLQHAMLLLNAQPADVSDAEINQIMYEHTKLNPNQADDVELLTRIRNAVRAILALRPRAVPMTAFLQPADMQWLQRFKETTEDDESYDVPKEAMKRLAELGVVRSEGFGRYSITAFGKHVTDPGCQFAQFPLMTHADHEATYRKNSAHHGITAPAGGEVE